MLDEIIFFTLSIIVLGGALKMVASPEPVHAAIYLGLVLGAVAGIYLTLSAEFLAAVQILIYVGAVVTLILFAVMLTTHASPTEGFAEDRTPLSTIGIGDAPVGMDVESLEEVPAHAETVEEAEQFADEDEEDTIQREPAGAGSDPALDEDASEEPGEPAPETGEESAETGDDEPRQAEDDDEEAAP